MPDTTNTTGTDDAPRGGQGFPAENPDGTPALIGQDAYTKQVQLDRINRGNVTVLTGNYADLQRMGETLAGGPGAAKNLSDAFAAPPGVNVSDENVMTPPQAAAAAGRYDRETIRTGLAEAPPAPTPRENKETNSVDPGSVSPKAESSGSTSASTTPSATKKP